MFVIVGSLVVLLLTAALVGPYFIDWSNYRAQFEAEASRVLGRQVTVRGAASARLLPFPSVTFSDVQVAGAQPGQTVMTADKFSMDAELAPLMSGEFRIFDMRLEHPHMVITIDQDGTLDWAVRPQTYFDARQISVEALTISDGQIDLVQKASGRRHSMTDLNAKLSARTLAGPWRMDGTMKLDGLDATLGVSTGTVDDAGSLRLRVSGGPDAYALSFDLDGNLRFQDKRPLYDGTLHLNASNARPQLAPSDAGKADGEGQPRQTAPVPDYRVSGAFSLSSDKLALTEARLETGPLDAPYTADGTAELSFGSEPRFSIRADGAQVRFDEALGGEDASGVTLEQRINALENVLGALPRPTIPGTVEVNLPAIVAGDTTIRDVQLSAQPAPEGWQLENFAASLPGRTRLESKGLLRTGSNFGFSGRLLLAVSQPSGFAAWLSKDVNEAIRRLPAAGFDAQVEIGREGQALNDLELQLGDARFRGTIVRTQPETARPSMNVALNGDALDVEGLAAFASIFVSDQGHTRLSDHDLDFQIKAGPVRATGLVADTLDTALRLRGERLEIDRLSVTGLAGASISATGSLDNLGSAPTGDLDASVVSTDLEPLINALNARYPNSPILRSLAKRAALYPGLFSDTRLDVVASAAGSDTRARGLALSAQGTSGGTTLQLTASSDDLSNVPAEMPVKIAFDASNEDGAALLGLLGMPTLPLGLLERAEMSVMLDGSLAKGLKTVASLHGEDIDGGFDGRISRGKAGLVARGSARLSAGDIEPWLMTTGLGIPGLGFGTPIGLAGTFTFDGGAISSSLEGSWNDSAVSGELIATLRNDRPHLAGTLSTDRVDLSDAAALVLGPESLAGAGDGGWSRQPFATASNLPFTLDMKLDANSLQIGPSVTIDKASLNLDLDQDGLRISDLAGDLWGGKLAKGLGSLQNNAGTALFSAQFELANALLEELSDYQAIKGRAMVGLTVSASGKSVDALASALSGSGSLRLNDLQVAGLNPNALPALITEADQIGREIDNQKVAQFAPQLISQGAMSLGSAEVAFSVANGVMRFPLTQFDTGSAKLAGELAVDLGEEALSGRATLSYPAGEDALAGSEPSVALSFEGPLASPQMRMDTTAIGQFLTQRALEIEQARVEAMQAQLLEQQRLRRETRYYEALQQQRLEDARRKAEEDARRAAEAAQAAAEAAQRERERAAAAEALRLEAERATREAEEAEQQAIERAAREAQQSQPRTEPRQQAPAASSGTGVNPFEMQFDVPEPQDLQPLPQPSAPGGGGSLPGVFDTSPGG